MSYITTSTTDKTIRQGLNKNTEYNFTLYKHDTQDILVMDNQDLVSIFFNIYEMDGLVKKIIDKPINDATNYNYLIKNNVADYNKKYSWLKKLIKQAVITSRITGGALILKYKENADYSQPISNPEKLITVNRSEVIYEKVYNDYRFTIPTLAEHIRGVNTNNYIHPDNFVIVPAEYREGDPLGISLIKKIYSPLKIVNKMWMNTCKSMDLNNTVFVQQQGASRSGSVETQSARMNATSSVMNSAGIFITDSLTQATVSYASLGSYKDLLHESFRTLAGACQMPLQILLESNTETAKSSANDIDISSYEKHFRAISHDLILPLYKSCLALMGVENVEVIVEDKYSYQKADDLSMMKYIGDALRNTENPAIKAQLEEYLLQITSTLMLT